MWRKIFPTLWAKKTSRHDIHAPLKNYHLEVATATDVGLCRSVNEDSIRLIIPNDKDIQTKKGILALLADGMGGHQAGEVASQQAITIIEQAYHAGPVLNPAETLRQAFKQANASVLQLSKELKACQGMGTTLLALVIRQGYAWFAHVGDSRLYLIRNAQCRQLSTDHTIVQEMLDSGLITQEQAAKHPNRNIITRAIGTQYQVKVEATDKPIRLEMGDVLLLCSDGLYDLVDDSEITSTVSTHEPAASCSSLVDLAKLRGGYDNISIILLQVHPEQRQVDIPSTRH